MKLEPQLHIERRVLAEVLTNPAALALADDLEVYDFTHPHHQVVFSALRNLQATDSDVDLLAVHDAIALRDMALETFKSHTLTVTWFTDLVVNSGRYGELLDVIFPADLRQLRRIAKERNDRE